MTFKNKMERKVTTTTTAINNHRASNFTRPVIGNKVSLFAQNTTQETSSTRSFKVSPNITSSLTILTTTTTKQALRKKTQTIRANKMDKQENKTTHSFATGVLQAEDLSDRLRVQEGLSDDSHQVGRDSNNNNNQSDHCININHRNKQDCEHQDCNHEELSNLGAILRHISDEFEKTRPVASQSWLQRWMTRREHSAGTKAALSQQHCDQQLQQPQIPQLQQHLQLIPQTTTTAA